MSMYAKQRDLLLLVTFLHFTKAQGLKNVKTKSNQPLHIHKDVYMNNSVTFTCKQQLLVEHHLTGAQTNTRLPVRNKENSTNIKCSCFVVSRIEENLIFRGENSILIIAKFLRS